MSNPNTIQGGRWDTFFRRKFNLKGGTNTPELAAEIIGVQNLPFEEEDHFLLGAQTAMGRGEGAAAAGQFSRIVLKNPAGSNKAIIIEGFNFLNTATEVGVWHFTAFTTGVVTPGFKTSRDTRWGIPTTALPILDIFTGNIAVALTNPHLRFQNLSTNVVIPLGVVLVNPPSDSAVLVFEALTADKVLRCNFWWREVILDPSASGFPV